MTSLYNSSRRPRIVFFHGLNNNVQCFDSLVQVFKDEGFETEMVVLPCHGHVRKEARSAAEAQMVFNKKMEKYKDVEWIAVGFSHGALYLELWLESEPAGRPLKQILLAPALFINHQKIISAALNILPSFLWIKSLAPAEFRRYEVLSTGEYNILVQRILSYQKLKASLKIPSLILIDPKDELVDAHALKKHLPMVEFIERRYLKKGPGCHHILFHPDYFTTEDWNSFTLKLKKFVEA